VYFLKILSIRGNCIFYNVDFVYGVKLFIIHQLFEMQIVSKCCCIFDKSRTQTYCT